METTEQVEKQAYGSTQPDAPLLKDEENSTAPTLPLTINLDNSEIRHSTFGILLFTWLLPCFLVECIKLSKNDCTDPQSCVTSRLFITSYVFMLCAMGVYKWMLMYLWHNEFSDEAQKNKCVTLLKYICGALLFIGGIVLTVAVANGLDELCIDRFDNDVYCKAGTFGIYLFPILTDLVLSADILSFRQDIGSHIRVRCGINSGIIFVSSLLITVDLFGSDTSFESVTIGLYQLGWIITCVVSLIICIYVTFGLYENVKQKGMKTFYGLTFVYMVLFSGLTLTLIWHEGYMDASRTTFLVLGLCLILNVELFLL